MIQIAQRTWPQAGSDEEYEIRPVKRVTLSQSILDAIADLVVRRVWRPGQAIPTEKDLAAQFGVGRSTIREVIQGLVTLGVIEIRPGEGSFVREPSSQLLSGAFRWSLLLSDTNVDDLIDTRLLVEVECAGRAANKPDADDLAKLDHIHRNLVLHLSDHNTFTEWDNRFHAHIADMARNALFARISTTIQVIGRVWYPITYAMNDTKSLTVAEHSKILEAIHDRDSPQARGAMGEHLAAAGARLKISLQRLGNDPASGIPSLAVKPAKISAKEKPLE